MKQTHRFLWLDGMRGIAALGVVLLHALDAFEADKGIIPNGGLAVNFFFVLSGFVIAYAYDVRFACGQTAWHFVRLRLVRLYPMIALGLLLGLAIYMFKIVAMHLHNLWWPLFGSVALNALLLPSPLLVTEDHGAGWPIDLPLWSLSFEFAVNVAYAVWLVHLRGWRMGLALFVGLVATLALYLQTGSMPGGVRWANSAEGFVGVFLPFTTGIVLARLHRSAGSRPPAGLNWLGIACAGVLILSMTFPVPNEHRAAYGLAVTCLLFPLLVWVGAIPGASRGSDVLAYLGDVSYPLYALHYPLVRAASFSMRRVGIDASHPLFWPCIMLEITVCLIFATLALRYIDIPVRNWLSHRLVRRHRHVTSGSASTAR